MPLSATSSKRVTSLIQDPMQRGFPVLLPDKHIRLSESIIGFAGLVLSQIDKPDSFDAVWKRVRCFLDSSEWPAAHGVDNFVLALCFLHSLGAVDVTSSGELFRCV